LIFKTSYELLLCIQYNAEASEILFHINPNEHGTKFLFSSEIGCKLATRLSLIDSLVAAHLGILPLLCMTENKTHGYSHTEKITSDKKTIGRILDLLILCIIGLLKQYDKVTAKGIPWLILLPRKYLHFFAYL
jgi:hypothetical protein